MDEATKRNFYRKCKEDIDFYLNTVQAEDYRLIYKLVGPPIANFIDLEADMAKDLLENLRLYFANKMQELP